MQNNVFVVDTDRKPLSPCHPAIARKLLRDSKAAVFRRFPFTIILQRAVQPTNMPPLQLKIDPGSKTTGMVLVQENKVVWAAELEHRGQQIRDALEKRRAVRRNRRQRKTRYRKPRFLNRTRPKGWLAPSLKSRVDNLRTWFLRLFRLVPITNLSLELVRFDTQLMQDAEISGVEYQQGELTGYEVREYLLEKFGRCCIYCGKKDAPLQVEHINPRGQGGSHRVSNLTLACEVCNKAKGNQTAAEFGYPEVQALAKQPLKDAAAVNAVRWAIWRMLAATSLPVEVGTGGRTKFNRARQGYPKAHWIDAACVGESGFSVCLLASHQPLCIKAIGRGCRRVCNVDASGFPRGKPKAAKRVYGFQSGDMVWATVPGGKKKGEHVGTVSIRTTGSFKINGYIDGISWRHCRVIHRLDGYSYEFPARFCDQRSSFPTRNLYSY
jgi:5-methylcytosine-specific restriction endonuclease McrA